MLRLFFRPGNITKGDRARDAARWDEAAKHYRRALELNPSSAPIWVQYGHMLKETGRHREAETAYRKAAEIEPGAVDTHVQLAHLLKLVGRAEEAAEHYHRAAVLGAAAQAVPPDADEVLAATDLADSPLPSEAQTAHASAAVELQDTSPVPDQEPSDAEPPAIEETPAIAETPAPEEPARLWTEPLDDSMTKVFHILLLGRQPDPETAAGYRGRPQECLIANIVRSDEFRNGVVRPFLSGLQLPHQELDRNELEAAASCIRPTDELDYRGDWLDAMATFEPPADLSDAVFQAHVFVDAPEPISLRCAFLSPRSDDDPDGGWPEADSRRSFDSGYTNWRFEPRPVRGKPDSSRVHAIYFGGNPSRARVRVSLTAIRGDRQLELIPAPSQPRSNAATSWTRSEDPMGTSSSATMVVAKFLTSEVCAPTIASAGAALFGPLFRRAAAVLQFPEPGQIPADDIDIRIIHCILLCRVPESDAVYDSQRRRLRADVIADILRSDEFSPAGVGARTAYDGLDTAELRLARAWVRGWGARVEPEASWSDLASAFLASPATIIILAQTLPGSAASIVERALEGEASPAAKARLGRFEQELAEVEELRASLSDMQSDYPAYEPIDESTLWDLVFRQGNELIKARELLARQEAVTSRLRSAAERVSHKFVQLSLEQQKLVADRKMAEAVERLASQRVLMATPRKFRVLYVSPEPHGASHQYRVENYIQALELNDIEADWISADECGESIDLLYAVSLVVFRRVPGTPSIFAFLEAAKQLGIPVVYDVDDHAFEPATSSLNVLGAYAHRTMLLGCQFALFPTSSLLECGRKLNRKSYLVPSGLEARHLDAIAGRPSRLVLPGRVVIGYVVDSYSGLGDIQPAAAAIARVLTENRNVTLRIVGDFDLDQVAEWRDLRTRIELEPTAHGPADRIKYPEFDINVAPRAIGRPQAEAKSEVEFFEAGLLGVPTVAAATGAFCDAISDGETGFIVRTGDDWYRALSRLVRDRGLRELVGAAAREFVIDAYGPQTLGLAARKIFSSIIRCHRAAQGRADDALVVTMVLDRLRPDSAIQATAISLMRGLSRHGHDIGIHIVEPPAQFATPDDFRAQHELLGHDAVTWGRRALRPADVCIATCGETLGLLGQQVHCAHTAVHLIGNLQCAPEAGSQQRPVRKLAIDPWVASCLKRDLNINADWLPFHVDRSVFRPVPGAFRSGDRLLVYLDSEAPADLAEAAIAGLTQFHESAVFRGQIEIVGSEEGLQVSFPHITHDMPSARHMARLFSECTLGIAVRPANPPPLIFGMMACGLPVIDFDFVNRAALYGAALPVLACAPQPDALAAAVTRLIAIPAERDQIAANALQFAAGLADETEVVRRFEEALVKYVMGPDHDDAASGFITDNIVVQMPATDPMSRQASNAAQFHD